MNWKSTSEPKVLTRSVPFVKTFALSPSITYHAESISQLSPSDLAQNTITCGQSCALWPRTTKANRSLQLPPTGHPTATIRGFVAVAEYRSLIRSSASSSDRYNPSFHCM